MQKWKCCKLSYSNGSSWSRRCSYNLRSYVVKRCRKRIGEKDREGMAMTVQACTGVVGMEKDYAKRLYAAFPVMSGSADPNNLSLDQKMVEGKRTAMMHDEGARLDYVVTQTDVMGKKVLGLYQVPGTAMQPTAQAVK